MIYQIYFPWRSNELLIVNAMRRGWDLNPWGPRGPISYLAQHEMISRLTRYVVTDSGNITFYVQS